MTTKLLNIEESSFPSKTAVLLQEKINSITPTERLASFLKIKARNETHIKKFILQKQINNLFTITVNI